MLAVCSTTAITHGVAELFMGGVNIADVFTKLGYVVPRVLLLAAPPAASYLMRRLLGNNIQKAVNLWPDSEDILAVFPANNWTTGDVIAVIHRRPQLSNNKAYPSTWQGFTVQYYSGIPSLEAQTVCERLNKISNATKELLGNEQVQCYHQSTENLKDEILKAMQIIISENCDNLFQRHLTLTVIKPDWVKSQNYNSDNPTEVNLTHTPCIVFYVLKKGIIPLDEDPLPSHLGGFVTDVREGLFYYLADNPPSNTAGHASPITLHPGCGISSPADKRGSLGGFVRCHASGKTGFLTSYHLFFNFHSPNPHPPGGESVYYVADSKPYRFSGVSCGSISSVPNQRVYKNVEYNLKQFGVDAVFVHMEHVSHNKIIASQTEDETAYIREQFPELPHDLQFATSPMPIEEVKRDILAYKYGHHTHSYMSEGMFVMAGTAVKPINETLRPHDTNPQLKAFLAQNMIAVRDIPNARGESSRFADKGDSGAFVFVLEDNSLRVVGMVEGGLSDGCHMVIPIEPVLHHMQLELI